MYVLGRNGRDGLRGERFSKQWGQGHWEQIRSRRVTNGVFCFRRKGAGGHWGTNVELGGIPVPKSGVALPVPPGFCWGSCRRPTQQVPLAFLGSAELGRTRALTSLRKLGAAFQVFKRSPSPVFTVGPLSGSRSAFSLVWDLGGAKEESMGYLRTFLRQASTNDWCVVRCVPTE